MKTAMMVVWALLFAATAIAEEGEGKEQTRWRGTGTVEYKLEHKLQTVIGRSSEPEFMMVVDESGLKVMARAAVRSFDSGNSNRDAQALAVVDAAHHPFVIVRGVAEGFRPPSEAKKMKVPLRAEVELKGVKVERGVDVLLDFREGGAVSASFEFVQSLEAHEIERPSLLMMRVKDELEVKGEALLEKVE